MQTRSDETATGHRRCRTPRVAYFVVTGGIVAAGLGALAWAQLDAPATGRAVGQTLLFLGLALLTRMLAFPLHLVRFSPDTAVFASAAVVLGPVRAAWVVLAATAGFDLLRLSADPGRPSGGAASRRNRALAAWRAIFGGVVAASTLWLAATVTGVGRHAAQGRLPSDTEALFEVPLLSLAWLASEYALVVVSLRLEGASWDTLLRRVLGPGLGAEIGLVPLAIVMVMLYDQDAPAAFLLLAALSLVFIYLLRRLGATGEHLMRRVRELELLNRFSQQLAATLDRDHLLRVAAAHVHALYETARVVAVGHRPQGTERFDLRIYDGCTQRVTGQPAERIAALARHVLSTGAELPDRHAPEAAQAAGDEEGWVGVPLIIGGVVSGVLVAQVDPEEATDVWRMEVFRQLARQLALALNNAQLYELATVDSVTGLYLRRYLQWRLADEMQRARQHGTPLAVILLDIDDFKQINDRFLHQTGDRVLRMVADVIRNWTRTMDVPCRLGGDEFAVVLPGAGADDALRVAERIRRGVADLRLTVGGAVVHTSVSAGVAAYPASGVDTPEALLERADVALFRAKAAKGKNCVAVASLPH